MVRAAPPGSRLGLFGSGRFAPAYRSRSHIETAMTRKPAASAKTSGVMPGLPASPRKSSSVSSRMLASSGRGVCVVSKYPAAPPCIVTQSGLARRARLALGIPDDEGLVPADRARVGEVAVQLDAVARHDGAAHQLDRLRVARVRDRHDARAEGSPRAPRPRAAGAPRAVSGAGGRRRDAGQPIREPRADLRLGRADRAVVGPAGDDHLRHRLVERAQLLAELLGAGRDDGGVGGPLDEEDRRRAAARDRDRSRSRPTGPARWSEGRA